jgi:hypothetical protein
MVLLYFVLSGMSHRKDGGLSRLMNHSSRLAPRRLVIRMMSPRGENRDWYQISWPVQIMSLFMIEVIVAGSSGMCEGALTHDNLWQRLVCEFLIGRKNALQSAKIHHRNLI